MKLNYWGLSLCLLAVISSCKNEHEPVTTSIESNVVKVKTVKVSISEESNNFRYSGSIEPSLTVPLSFKTTGTIEEVYVNEGDAVKKDQLLAILDNSDMENVYQVAHSKYQQAKDAYDRLKTVYDEGGLTEIKWVEMETGFEQAKASLEIAQSNLDKCNLRAPTEGIIGTRNIEPGQSTIGLNLEHMELVQLNTVYVKVSVPENEIGRIRKGQKAEILVSALNNRQFKGTVNTINPVAERISRTYAVKIAVSNPNLELKPGMVCDVALNLGNASGILTVPYKAVSKDNEGITFVYLLTPDNKRVKKQPVTVGNYHISEIEILEGVSEGQIIVCEGAEKLSDNSLISM